MAVVFCLAGIGLDLEPFAFREDRLQRGVVYVARTHEGAVGRCNNVFHEALRHTYTSQTVAFRNSVYYHIVVLLLLPFLRVQGSMNGVFVNDFKVREHTLRHGDVVQFGGAADISIGTRFDGSGGHIR